MSWYKRGSTGKIVQDILHSASHRMLQNWALIGGGAAVLVAGLYVLYGPTSPKKRKRRGMVPGLLNLGNTCYLNSLLQGLAACPSFLRWLDDFSCDPERDVGLSRSLMLLLQALSSHGPGEDDVLDAAGLLEVLRLHRWHISSFEEQDAHELFHMLTSSLEEEGERQPRIAHLFDMRALQSSVRPEETHIRCRAGGEGPSHPIPGLWRSRHPFHGRFNSCMSCKRCEQQSPVHYDSFHSLSLAIPSSPPGVAVSLEQCLRHFLSSETIQEVECEICSRAGSSPENQRSTFVKQLKLAKLPRCLCIHLQRLSWSSEGTPIKRHEHVRFSEFLSLQPGTPPPLPRRNPPCPSSSDTDADSTDSERHNKNKSVINGTFPSVFLHSTRPSSRPGLTKDLSSEALFRLTAVLVHHGDARSGHFITYRRGPSAAPGVSPQWLCVSDESVRRCSLQEALSCAAYLLFYERVELHRTPEPHQRPSENLQDTSQNDEEPR